MIQPAASPVRNEQQMDAMVGRSLTEVGRRCPNIAFIRPKWPPTKFEVNLICECLCVSLNPL